MYVNSEIHTGNVTWYLAIKLLIICLTLPIAPASYSNTDSSICGPDKVYDKYDSKLCYKKCPKIYVQIGRLCAMTCPENFKSRSSFCEKPYLRARCPEGMRDEGAYCVPHSFFLKLKDGTPPLARGPGKKKIVVKPYKRKKGEYICRNGRGYSVDSFGKIYKSKINSTIYRVAGNILYEKYLPTKYNIKYGKYTNRWIRMLYTRRYETHSGGFMLLSLTYLPGERNTRIHTFRFDNHTGKYKNKKRKLVITHSVSNPITYELDNSGGFMVYECK